jgi:hypothetical protein
VLSLVQFMQIAQYINMISIDSPAIFNIIYSKADLMSNVNLNFTFINNPFGVFSKCSKVDTPYPTQIESPSFIYNTGNQIFVWVLLAVLFGVSRLMLRCANPKCVKMRNFFEEIYNSFFYSLPIETVNELFMTIIFYAFLNLFQVQC